MSSSRDITSLYRGLKGSSVMLVKLQYCQIRGLPWSMYACREKALSQALHQSCRGFKEFGADNSKSVRFLIRNIHN